VWHEWRRAAYRVLVGRPEGSRPLGRPRGRWEDNIKVDLPEVIWGGMEWNGMAQEVTGLLVLEFAVLLLMSVFYLAIIFLNNRLNTEPLRMNYLDPSTPSKITGVTTNKKYCTWWKVVVT
jgi:hypothetical protein